MNNKIIACINNIAAIALVIAVSMLASGCSNMANWENSFNETTASNKIDLSLNETQAEIVNQLVDLIIVYEEGYNIEGNLQISSADDVEIDDDFEKLYLDNSNYMFSLDEAEWKIYLYNLCNDEKISLASNDLLNLLSTPNEETKGKLSLLAEWYSNKGESKEFHIFNPGVNSIQELYYDKYGESLIPDSEGRYLNAKEKIEVIEWAISHPNEYIDGYNGYKYLLEEIGCFID